MLDQFYTKEQVAIDCIKEVIDIDDYDIIVEPSAGTGSFSSNIKGCLGFDLDPKRKEIKKKNWLDVSREDIGSGKTLIIGNPPFGKRSKLAKDFITHAISLDADTIAFILPKIFSKYSNQKIFSKDWKLIKVLELSRESFIYEGKDKHVPCNFYIWTKLESKIDLRKKEYKLRGEHLYIDGNKVEKKVDFIFLNRGDSSSDFCLNGNSGKIKDIEEVSNEKAEHYIKCFGIKKNELIKKMNSIDFNFMSSVEGENAWISRQEILEAYYN